MKKAVLKLLTMLVGVSLIEITCWGANSVTLQDMLGKHMDRVMRKSGLVFPTRYGEPFTNWFGRVVMEGEDALPFGYNYIQLRDSDGWAEVRDETGALTREVAPIREDAAFVFGDLFGFLPSEDTPPELRLSHLVSKWLVCHSQEESDAIDITDDEWDVLQSERTRRRNLRNHRLAEAPLVVTNLMTTAIVPSENYVDLMVEWPSSMTLPYDFLDLYCSVDLRNWTRYDRYDVNTCQNQFEVQIPKVSIPGFLEHLPAQHEATCYIVTNISASAFQPGVSYTNRHWNCDHKPRGETPGFFRWAALTDDAGPGGSEGDGDDSDDANEDNIDSYVDDYLLDSDGDGLSDGWENEFGLNPNDPNDADVDSDGDGLTNRQEWNLGTDPLSADSDNDGMSDGAEVQAGKNPAFWESDLGRPAEWVRVCGQTEADEMTYVERTVTVPAHCTCFVGVYLSTDEAIIPHNDYAFFQDDNVEWSVAEQGGIGRSMSTLYGSTNIQSYHDQLIAATDSGRRLQNRLCGSVLVQGAFCTATTTPKTLRIRIGAGNSGDNSCPSYVDVGVHRVRVVQSNYPDTRGSRNGTTDMGGNRKFVYVSDDPNIPNNIAYITGEPAAPMLWAYLAQLPQWVSVSWSGSLTSERSERGSLDDRTLEETTLGGESPLNITQALLNDEIVGGQVSLNLTVNEMWSQDYSFKIRGKNPRDSEVETYIRSHAPAGYEDLACMIACHESWDSRRYAYNQFNATSRYGELPNYGAPDGWGIGQIDRSGNDNEYTSTAEVYDWRANIASMCSIMANKLSDAQRFLSYYRQSYANSPLWTEPPDTVIKSVTITPLTWACAYLYNGANGIPNQTTPTHAQDFKSPLQFVPSTGEWLFHRNTKNPRYIEDAINKNRTEKVE